MRIHRTLSQSLAISLAALTLLATSPVSAAELTAPSNIGSVTAIGQAKLRDISLTEGTIFSGDRLTVAPGAYAKVVVTSGPQIEVGGNSDVVVTKDNGAVSVRMTSGNVAFTGKGQQPVHVSLGVYEISATPTTKGSVAFVGREAFGVRVLDGVMTVRNTATKQSYTVQKGSERLVSLNSSNGSPVLLASSAPSSIPPAPAVPAQGLSHNMKTALIVTSVVGSAAAIALLMHKNDDSDSEAAARLVRTQALNNTSALKATASQIQSTAQSVTTTSTQAASLINGSTLSAANKTALTNQANSINSRAASANSAITSLQSQINSLESSIQTSGTVTSAQQSQLNTLISLLETQRNNLNQALQDLLNLILSANQLAGSTIIPTPNLQPVNPPNIASPSNPS